MASIEGLIEAAEASGNPHTLAFALHAFSLAFHDIDPACALDALRRRLKIAQDRGNRYDATNLATMLCRIEAVTVTLLPLSITSPWPSAVTSTPATPR